MGKPRKDPGNAAVAASEGAWWMEHVNGQTRACIASCANWYPLLEFSTSPWTWLLHELYRNNYKRLKAHIMPAERRSVAGGIESSPEATVSSPSPSDDAPPGRTGGRPESSHG